MIYKTKNSTYEVDTESKLIRRITTTGVQDPTNPFGDDWMQYLHLEVDERLRVTFVNGRTAVTTRLQ